MSAANAGFLREALFNGNGIARKLILALVAFSSLITAVITAIELRAEYQAGLKSIDDTFSVIERAYLPSLVQDVWVADAEQVRVTIAGLKQLTDIEYAAVLVDGAPRWSVGKPESRRTRVLEAPLTIEHRGEPLTIGALRVVASVDRVIARVLDHLVAILIANGIKTGLVAAFLLLVFQWLVTRHLTRLAQFVRALDPRAPKGDQVQLDRPATGRWRPDVLDAISGAINGLSRRLADAQRELRGSEERFRAIVEAQDDAVCRWLPDTTLTYANPRYRELFGLGGQDVLGRRWLEFVPEDERPQIAAFYAELPNAPRRVEYEHTATAADGSLRWIAWTDVPLFDATGRLIEFQSVGRDITQRRQAEEALASMNQTLEQRVRSRTAELERTTARAEQASRAKSEFLSRMSHELRTPLNAVLGFAQLLELSNPTEQQRAWAVEIRRAGDHLLQLIDELLDLSRIEAGKMALRIEAVPVAPLVREAVAFVQPALAASGVGIDVELCTGEAVVQADGVRLRQILVNLLSNAIKYNRPGGRVLVGCEPLGADRLRLTVADTGIGIGPERLDQLFRPFERLGADARGIEGTGIGLALSRQLAWLMGGDIGVESTPGVGTTFWVDLPRAAPAPAPSVAADPAPPAAVELAGCVLCIEDNPSNLALVCSLLAPHPRLRLLTAADGVAGLAAARTHRPDAILLDIRMPGLDGFAVLRELRADPTTQSIPVIALTAEAMPDEIARGLAAGFAGYLTKPLQVASLMQALAAVLRVGSGGDRVTDRS